MSVARFVADQRTMHRVPHTVTCAILGISISWFYKWIHRGPTQRAARDHRGARQRGDLRADHPPRRLDRGRLPNMAPPHARRDGLPSAAGELTMRLATRARGHLGLRRYAWMASNPLSAIDGTAYSAGWGQ